MPAIVVEKGLLVTVTGTILSQPWANVFGVRLVDDTFLDQADVDEIAADFRTFYDSLKSSLSTAWTATGCVVADLQSAAAPSWDAAWTAVVGQVTANPLPPQFAVCASHKTGLRGKSYNGRTFVCGYTEDSCDTNGQVISAHRSGLVNSFNTLRTNLEANPTAPGSLAVVSRKLAIATPITATTVDAEFDHQDRRKRG